MRHPIRRAAHVLALLLLVGLALSSAAAAFVYHYGETDHTAPADAIVVLGGGTLPNGQPSASTARRARHGADLYRRGLAPVIICSGGFTSGIPTSEAMACSEAAQRAGVPASAILLEEHSTSTEENAIETRKIMDAHHFKTALLVSDGFHMLRAEWMFHVYGMTVLLSPVPAPLGLPSLVRTVLDTYREVAALAWYIFKSVLRLPFTTTKTVSGVNLTP